MCCLSKMYVLLLGMNVLLAKTAGHVPKMQDKFVYVRYFMPCIWKREWAGTPHTFASELHSTSAKNPRYVFLRPIFFVYHRETRGSG